MKVHVFVDTNNNVLAITPVPVSSSSKPSPTGEIVFGHAEPAQRVGRMKRYELDTGTDLAIDPDPTDTEYLNLHQRIVDVLRARPDLQSVEVS